MSLRGRILKDPSLGPGLVLVDGRQYHFALEQVWKSERLPRRGLMVEVQFDPPGEVCAMSPLPVAHFGVTRMTALLGLAGGWFALATLDVNAGVLGRMQLSFWQLLGILNSGATVFVGEASRASRPGAFGVLAIVCLAAPLLPWVWRDGRAHLGGVLPLALMLIVAGLVGFALPQQIPLQEVSVSAGLPTALLAGAYFAVVGVRDFLARRGIEPS